MPVCNSKVFLCGLPPDCQEDSLKSFLEGVFEEFFNPLFSHNVILMGLTDRRKTAKSLVDSCKNCKNLAVSRKR